MTSIADTIVHGWETGPTATLTVQPLKRTEGVWSRVIGRSSWCECIRSRDREIACKRCELYVAFRGDLRCPARPSRLGGLLRGHRHRVADHNTIDYIEGTADRPRACKTLAAWVAVCNRDVNWFLDCAGPDVDLDSECLFFARLGSTRCEPEIEVGGRALNPTHRLRMVAMAILNRDAEMLRTLVLRGTRIDTPILLKRQTPSDIADESTLAAPRPAGGGENFKPILEWVHEEANRVTRLHEEAKRDNSDQEAMHYFIQARAFNEMLTTLYRAGEASAMSRMVVSVKGRTDGMMSIPFSVQSGLIDYIEWRTSGRVEIRVQLARHASLSGSTLDKMCDVILSYDDRLSLDASSYDPTSLLRMTLWDSVAGADLAVWNDRSKRYVATRAEIAPPPGDASKMKSKRKLKHKVHMSPAETDSKRSPSLRPTASEGKEEKKEDGPEPELTRDEAATFQYQLYDRAKRIRKMEIATTDAELARCLESLSTGPPEPAAAAAAGRPVFREPALVDLFGHPVPLATPSTRKRRV